jgi:hypothetical protein
MALANPRAAARLLLACAVTALASCEARAPDPALATELADIARKLETTNELLRAIEKQLGQAALREPSTGGAPLAREEARPPDTDAVERLTAVLAEQFRAMQAQIDALPSTMAPAEPIPRRQPLPKQIDAVTATINRFLENPEAERARHFQWSQADVYATYGTPDQIDPAPLQIFWYYRQQEKAILVFAFQRGQNTTQVNAERIQ